MIAVKLSLHSELFVRAALKTRIVDPRHAVVLLEEFGNLLRTFPFGYRFAFFQRLKQPAVEFCFGTAILEVGKASIGNLGFVFDRFHHRDRVYPFDKG